MRVTAGGVLFECYICMNIHSHKPSRVCDIDSTSLLSRYGGFGIRSHDGPPKGTWEKHKSVEVQRCVDAQGHIVEFYEKTECHKDTSQLLMLETQPSSGGG